MKKFNVMETENFLSSPQVAGLSAAS